MSEIQEKTKVIGELTMTIAKMQGGFFVKRIPACGRGMHAWPQ
jgi:hypothetical protein